MEIRIMDKKNDVNYVVMDQQEINKCRHKAEKRWYRRLVVLNFIFVIGILVWFMTETNQNKDYFVELKDTAMTCFNTIDQTTETSESATKKLQDKVDEFPDSLMMASVIVGLMIAFPFILNYMYAQFRSMSVRITEKNFPEIYEIVEEYTQKLGLKEAPAIYLVQGNGILNAFATCIPFKQYIELYADLVEVAYREHHDMESLRFIIAHEISHIRYSHAKLHYNYLILFANMIPILSKIASRTREYSCDRLAQKLSGSDGIEAMMALTAGIHLYKNVDKADYIENAKKVKGFFVWCYNLGASHPVTSKRVLALEMKEGSGKLY
ncbi:M48 family peptidase [Lachnotalea glycerini]|uniref:M48 family peptidase n=2 Tax=Lachnotalea glycerini TaxID=1763509 RepID=A0A371JB13_9FIRM|nr:M48 family peptidase [Lachnotalea glycerini]